MRIEHVAVWTADLERLREFYVAHFGATAGPRYENPGKGFASYFLSFAGGTRLELMTVAGLPESAGRGPRPGAGTRMRTGAAARGQTNCRSGDRRTRADWAANCTPARNAPWMRLPAR